MANSHVQIEQFIERIFPSQSVEVLTAEGKAKEVLREKERKVDFQENMILIGAVLIVLVTVGGLMVGCLPSTAPGPHLSLTLWQIGTAWFMGARYNGISEKIPFLGNSGPTPDAPPPLKHEEL